jgi:hypothetical protein
VKAFDNPQKINCLLQTLASKAQKNITLYPIVFKATIYQHQFI